MKQPKKLKTRQLLFYAALLVLVIVVMFSLKNCNPPSPQTGDSPKPSGGDTIDIAIEYSPTFMYTYDDTLGGFCHDLLLKMAADHNRPVKFHPVVALSKGLEGLENGLYDVLVAQFPVTRENKQNFLFTDELYLDRQVLVQRLKSNGKPAITSQLDLAGDTVVVVKDSPMDERIRSLGREIGDTIYIIHDPQYGPEQLVIMVSTGDIKMAVVNESIARRMKQKYHNLDISTEISFTQFQAMTLKKDNQALCDTLNLWLREARKSVYYTTLKQRYFDVK